MGMDDICEAVEGYAVIMLENGAVPDFLIAFDGARIGKFKLVHGSNGLWQIADTGTQREDEHFASRV